MKILVAFCESDLRLLDRLARKKGASRSQVIRGLLHRARRGR